MTDRGWLATGVVAGVGVLAVAAGLNPGAIPQLLADGLPIALLGASALAAFPIARHLGASRSVRFLSEVPISVWVVAEATCAVAAVAASGGSAAGPVSACLAFGLVAMLAVVLTRSGANALTSGADSADSLTMTPASTDTEASSQRARAA